MKLSLHTLWLRTLWKNNCNLTNTWVKIIYFIFKEILRNKCQTYFPWASCYLMEHFGWKFTKHNTLINNNINRWIKWYNITKISVFEFWEGNIQLWFCILFYFFAKWSTLIFPINVLFSTCLSRHCPLGQVCL